MDMQSNSNSSSDSEERKKQERDELANEIFGSLESDTDNNKTSSSSSTTSSPIIMMKKQPTAKEPSKNIEIPDVKEALNEYFKLKQKYENQIMINKKKIINNPSLSKREKRAEYLKLKPKCINCNRPGGTRFLIHYVPENSTADNYEEHYREYSATCGIIADPCNLNIKIYSGNSVNLAYILNIFKNEIIDVKDTIIRQKLDTLFSYISEEKSVSLFKKELNTYNKNSDVYKDLLATYENLFDNKNNEDLKHKKMDDIFILKEKLRDLLIEYEKTENGSILKSAMDLQINELYPEIRNLRLLQNEVLELNEHDNNHFSIFKYPVQLSKIDHNLGEKPEVLKFSL
jgi:hypothetical protein